MTIAACYVSTEGVVFGADSATTVTVTASAPGGSTRFMRHYNFAQKVFQIGERSTLGIVTWGLAETPNLSHRATIARFSDHLLTRSQLPDMAAVANEWAAFFWDAYTKAFPADIQRAVTLEATPNRSPAEQKEHENLLQRLSGGFCIGGNLLHARTPQAFEVTFRPNLTDAPKPVPIPTGDGRFWGVPVLWDRLIKGIDPRIRHAILTSGQWQGDAADLDKLTQPLSLSLLTVLPIREAVDYVHSAIYTTIKAMKFSQLPPVCGGPVEVAVITADRHFRWVRHKSLNAALSDGEVNDAERS